MLLEATTLQRAEEWCRSDPNETTVAYVRRLVASKEEESAANELEQLFPASKRINFGTAGLRSAMKPGPLGMNDLVVVQTAQGLAKYCLQQNQQQIDTKLCAIVGYDHRANPTMNLSSLSFALLTTLVFLEAGLDVFLLDNFVFTPLVPFCISQLANACVGIMITASHNPRQDAGYKVYWKDGCQIRSPLDQEISDAILQNLKPWIDYRQRLQGLRQVIDTDCCLGLSRPKQTKEMIDAYFQALCTSGLVTGQAKLLQEMAANERRPPVFCYTAMHGVGHCFARQCFQTFGLPPFHSVPQQQDPDFAFPTVSFPNPEEKGALDLAKAYAEQQHCNIVLAHDPDADRLAVAERDQQEYWTVFTGDQIGTMLGHWLWTTVGQQQQQSLNQKPVAMCASTVSSQMLAEIARVEHFHFEDTLTGFKWIGSRAAELHRSGGYNSIFCYEEAMGFCCGNVIFDKDGISALGVFAELAVHVYHQGRTLAQHMQSLYDKYGEFVSNNGYYFLQDPRVVPTIMDEITDHGSFTKLKGSVGGYKIESFRYLGEPGYDSTTKDNRPTLPTSRSSPMMTIRFTNGCVVQLRASGTEPKFKYYIELKGKPGVLRSKVVEDLEEMSAIVLEELLHPGRHGLVRP